MRFYDIIVLALVTPKDHVIPILRRCFEGRLSVRRQACGDEHDQRETKGLHDFDLQRATQCDPLTAQWLSEFRIPVVNWRCASPSVSSACSGNKKARQS